MKTKYRNTKIKGRQRLEHRRVMERIIGRVLGRLEFVHHKNGDKGDNRPENLEIVTPKEHATKHGQWKNPPIKVYEICGSQYTPKPTKRKRSRTCSRKCGYALRARTRYGPHKAAAFIRACMEVDQC